jgi:L-fucose isomerase-like protein
MSAGQLDPGRNTRFVYTAVVSPLHEPEALRELLADFAAALERLGGTPARPAAEQAALPVLVLMATGGTERAALEALAPRPGDPVLLLAHPGHNSLAAALEVLARVQREGRVGRIVYLEGPQDEPGLARLGALVHEIGSLLALRRCRIGLVGKPSDWLVASSPTAELVRARWGATLVELPLERLRTAVERASASDDAALGRSWLQGAERVLEPSPEAVSVALRVHRALRDLGREERLDALTVRCFELVSMLGTTGCCALAELNDQGVVAGCEGDVPSVLAMAWVKLLCGSAAWMANPTRVDHARRLLLLAHCTVPRSLVRSYRLRSHFESGIGVGIQGVLAPGPVTLLRIGGASLERLWLAEGTLEHNTDHADLCRTQVEVHLEGEALDALLCAPLGNHLVVVPGHHAARLGRSHGWLAPAPAL